MCGSSGSLPGREVEIIANCEDKTESDICNNLRILKFIIQFIII